MIAGEMCLSPVGLSVTTKLAPKAFEAQTLAIWLLADAFSQAINAQIARFYTPQNRRGLLWHCRWCCSSRRDYSFYMARKPIRKLIGNIH